MSCCLLRLICAVGFVSAAFVFVPTANGGSAPTVDDTWIKGESASLDRLYRDLHAHPELSLEEVETSQRMARELKAIGISVTERVGGYGVVGVLKNGTGPVVMIRSDMDALPIKEQTGRDYASKVVQKQANGETTGVMHACGHDVHMTVLLGTARYLAAHRQGWSGTVVFVFQPAEERGLGSAAMLKDGLYKRFPKPSYALAYHVASVLPAGQVGWVSGPALSSATSVDVVINGRGGHAAMPNLAVDPVVLAAQFVLDLQTLVSRSMNPMHPAVVTVGTIHGGTKYNIIPDEVTLQLSIRVFHKQDREMIIDQIKKRAEALAVGHGAPLPVIKVSESVGETVNAPELVQRVLPALRAAIGEANVVSQDASMGSEDFGAFSVDGVVGAMFWLGASEPALLKKAIKTGVALPSMHSALFAPDAPATIATGIKGMTAMVVDLLRK